MALDYGTVEDYHDRGFGFVSRTLECECGPVFFHIKVIKRKYPDLAAALDDDPYETLSFWYDTETTARGDQVRELWLNISEIPEEFLGKTRVTVEQLWLASQAPLPPDTERVIQAVLGQPRYHELRQAAEQQRRERQELAEAERRRKEEQQRRERLELAETERRRKEEQQRRQQEAEQRRREEVARNRALQSQAEQEREAALASSQPPARSAQEPVPPRVQTPPPDDPEWQASVYTEDSLRREEAWAAITRHLTERSHAEQSPEQGTRSSEVGSPDGRGFWYRQFMTPGGSIRAGAATESQLIETKIVGVTYENRQSVVKRLSEGEQIRLCREPNNPYDHNAIRVERLTGEKIGYISRVEATAFAPAFDTQSEPVLGIVTAILRAYSSDSALGVRIRFTAPEGSAGQRSSIPEFRDSWEDRA